MATRTFGVLFSAIILGVCSCSVPLGWAMFAGRNPLGGLTGSVFRTVENDIVDVENEGTDEPGSKQEKFERPFWNVWQEEGQASSPRYKPVSMKPDHDYLVAIDLAALAYDKYVVGTYSREVDDDFDRWLKQNKEDEATFVVLAIPDERFFEPLVGTARTNTLTINLKKLRQVRQRGFKVPTNPFEILAQNNGTASFNFGTVSFVVRTKKNVAGDAAIAFSFWNESKPVTELWYSTCIRAGPTDACSAIPPTRYSLIGVDTNNYHKSPDAALHFVELNSETLVGIYRCNTCGWGPYEFKQWRLAGGANWFRQQFVQTVLPGIRLASNGPDVADPSRGDQLPAYSQTTFENAADSLYRLLFPDNPAAEEAEASFGTFVAQAVANPPPDGIPPSIFIRLLPQYPEKFFVVPLGLTRVPLADGKPEFLGYHFRIQTPLELQDYSQHLDCPTKWVLLMPPVNLVDNPLSRARDEFKDWINIFSNDSIGTTYFEDVNKFKDWLVVREAAGSKAGNYAVMILSHHASNSLFIDQTVSSIFAPIIRRSFGNPSIAIIDACGTANPGAFEFVKDFNNHGVYTLIASSVEVDAKMGGDFLRSLIEAINTHSSDQTYSIDRAVFDAIRDLSKQSDGSDTPLLYGPRALVYGLLGNGSLRLCVPAKSSSTKESATENSGAEHSHRY